MKTAKLGVMFLASVFALAGIGIGYSAWTDTINIHGTVNTGSVGWHFVNTSYSGTWVYKDLEHDAEGAEIHDTPFHLNDPTHMLVAWAYAEENGDDHHASVVFGNLFPCIDFEADLTIEYTGSVPGKINNYTMNDPWPEDANESLLDAVTTLNITVMPYGKAPYFIEDLEDLFGLQLHKGDLIHVVMIIHIPQDNDYMNLSGDFDVDVEVVQWNEYPYTPAP